MQKVIEETHFNVANVKVRNKFLRWLLPQHYKISSQEQAKNHFDVEPIDVKEGPTG